MLSDISTWISSGHLKHKIQSKNGLKSNYSCTISLPPPLVHVSLSPPLHFPVSVLRPGSDSALLRGQESATDPKSRAHPEKHGLQITWFTLFFTGYNQSSTLFPQSFTRTPPTAYLSPSNIGGCVSQVLLFHFRF